MGLLVCNRCGRRLKVEQDIVKEDYIQIRKSWGYFSRRDGITQEFILCEECVESITREFVVPAEFSDTKELL
ncbi:MAG: hypothetical protein K2K56_00490 [Lachnospiraceae bacterium]|nr:hypothetical protein [Lachnospiraceae bacterium]MDE6624826.1 hypothetical protein [Lachnospiraceae bacterium]